VETSHSRQNLRREIRLKRQNLSLNQQRSASIELVNILCNSPHFIQSQNIAVYLASDGEISPQAVIEAAWAKGKQVYLPVVHTAGDEGAEKGMAFYRYNSDTPLQRNVYGIEEPVVEHSESINPEDLDLVLLPLVAFDRQGGRLGMGGGYYDRAFEFKAGQAHLNPFLLGLAHHCQEVDYLALAAWDIPLAAVATDIELIEA